MNPSVHFTFAKQEENIALLVYSQNSDLRLFSKDNLYVTLILCMARIICFWKLQWNKGGNWIVASKDSSYISMYHSCLDVNADGFSSCSAAKQVWACVVVGHQDIHHHSHLMSFLL